MASSAGMALRKRFNVDDYYRMADAGILGERERVELIDGEVVTMAPIGPRHSACVDCAIQTFVLTTSRDAIVRAGNPVRLNRFNEPQPDLTLLRPTADFYASAHPGPGDVLLVVEIADSSLGYDRGVKAKLYAEWGLVDYWLADLKANTLWVYSSPEGGAYQAVEQHRRGESIAPRLLPSCVVAVDAFLIE
jgi:Uma2 family endonuclease